MRTPWGIADYEHVYAEGIVFYGTPSHGGFKLTRNETPEMPDALFYNGSSWFEEDCEAYKVFFAFPQVFVDPKTDGYQTVERSPRKDRRPEELVLGGSTSA